MANTILLSGVGNGATSAWSPSDLANLELWLKADAITGLNDGDPVATWPDSSGNGYDAAQANAAKRPLYKTGILNGLPVARFDATDDGMQVDVTLSVAAPYSIFVVYNCRKVGLSGIARRTVQGSSNWLIGPYSFDNKHYANGWVSTGNTVVQYQFYLACAINTGAASAFFIDGADVTDDGTKVGAPGNIGLGTSGAYAEVADGDIAEIILYSAELSAADRQLVEGYLSAKYAL